ncbi:MAG: hypothetical protein OXT65_10920 [Alphaproteobacteria bacterium]|nr:hypothetical protein [Alphaproteobacteria bacterium]
MNTGYNFAKVACLLTVLLLFAAAAVFEFLPLVKEARYAVPDVVYEGHRCGCECISGSRPWYSTFNYWKWVWILTVPLLVVCLGCMTSRVQKAAMICAAIGLCYLSMNLAVHLFWDIRNAPFIGLDFSFTGGKGCVDIGDGASIGFILLFGWVPAGLYVVFWLAVTRIASLVLKRKS